MKIYKILISLIFLSLSLTSCNFEWGGGSTSISTTMGKSISLSCATQNLERLENISISSDADTRIELTGAGVKSTFEYKLDDQKIVSYTLTTKTEKTSDGPIHQTIEAAINRACVSVE